MTLTIDVHGVPLERYVFDTSPLAELAAMLHVLVEPDHHEDRAPWAKSVLAATTPDLRSRLEESSVLWRSSRADFLLPSRPKSSLRHELDDVDHLNDEVWVDAALVTTSCGSVPTTARPALLASLSARQAVLRRVQARGSAQARFAARILADPPGVRRWVRELLLDCEQAFFAEEWQHLLPQLTAESRHKADLAARHGLRQAMEAVSPTIQLDEERDRLVIDKIQDNATSVGSEAVTFLASSFGDPHILIVHAPGWAPVVQYPATKTATVSSSREIQQRLRALDHPMRIRLLRTLARGPHTTGELATAWNLTSPEVSRHLAILKRASLVTADRKGRYVMYELDVRTLPRLGTDILEALLI